MGLLEPEYVAEVLRGGIKLCRRVKALCDIMPGRHRHLDLGLKRVAVERDCCLGPLSGENAGVFVGFRAESLRGPVVSV